MIVHTLVDGQSLNAAIRFGINFKIISFIVTLNYLIFSVNFLYIFFVINNNNLLVLVPRSTKPFVSLFSDDQKC